MAVKNHKTTHGAFLIVNNFYNSLGQKNYVIHSLDLFEADDVDSFV